MRELLADQYWVRPVLFVLCLIVVAEGTRRCVRDWDHWTPRQRAVRAHLSALAFGIGVATADGLWQKADVRPGSFLITAIMLSLVIWLIATHDHHEYGPDQSKMDKPSS